MFNLSVARFYQSSINRLHKKSYFFRFVKYHDTFKIVITLSLLPIALYVSQIQHSIC